MDGATNKQSPAPVQRTAEANSPWAKRSASPLDGPRRWAGGLISVIYVGLAIAFACFRWDSFETLPPNELGDFLAGVFAPLAFLWLVLGFFQQGEELRQSSDALWLQGQELQNSVEQQRELVNVTREQLAFERDRIAAEAELVKRQAQPNFVFGGGSHRSDSSGTHMTFHLLNRGNTATDVSLKISEERSARWDMLRNGDRYDFNLVVENDHELGLREFEITYTDALGHPGSATLWLNAVSAGSRRILRTT